MKKLLLIGFILINTIAFSQVEKGDKNLTFNALYTGGEGFALGMISGKFGYFVTQHIEAGVTPSLSVIKAGDETITSPGLGLYGTYNWLTADAKLLPYAGASINFIKVIDQTETSFGLYGGSKYFLTESLNIDGGLQVQALDGNALFIFQVGIGFILGKTN